MRKNNRFFNKGKTAFAILVDGETEFWYFQMLKRNERSLRVDLKPEIPNKKKLKEQFQKIISYSKDYDKVFWIVDFDTIISESKSVKKGEKPAIKEFEEYYKKLENYKNVIVIINNPCFEFWLLLHFEQTGKYFSTCEAATKRLIKYLPDYEKTQKYYTKQDNDIYLKLKSKINTAIENAKRLIDFDLEYPFMAMTEMQLIFEEKDINDAIFPQDTNSDETDSDNVDSDDNDSDSADL